MRWGRELDLELWRHYELRNIDPHINDHNYIIDKIKTYFPEWYTGLSSGRTGTQHATRLIRDKNSVRRVQIANHREGEGD